MASGNPAHASSTEHEIGIYDCISVPRSILTTTYLRDWWATPSCRLMGAIVPMRKYTLVQAPLLPFLPKTRHYVHRPLRWLGQINHYSTATTLWPLKLSVTIHGDPLPTNPILFGHPQVWEHPMSFLDERIDCDTSIMQNYRLEVDTTQSRPAHSHLNLSARRLGAQPSATTPT